jgi:UDP-2-acetamido-2,6-beta-L-arabino-hexul-4-ose reductase
MINIGITGQAGFIGTHLYNFFGLKKDEVVRIPFEDKYFDNHKTDSFNILSLNSALFPNTSS